MLPLFKVRDIQETEREKFRTISFGREARLVGLLFCRPELKVMREEIIPSLDYFDVRSGDTVAFYFAGFSEVLSGTLHNKIPIVGVKGGNSRHLENSPAGPWNTVIIKFQDGRRWFFDTRSFDALRNEVESQTRWRYSGGCDLILANSFRWANGDIDYSNAMVLCLDKIQELVATPTVSQLFEAIFQYCDTQRNDENPTWGLSDYLGIKTGRVGLWDGLLGLIPESLRPSLRAAKQVVVQDIARH